MTDAASQPTDADRQVVAAEIAAARDGGMAPEAILDHLREMRAAGEVKSYTDEGLQAAVAESRRGRRGRPRGGGGGQQFDPLAVAEAFAGVLGDVLYWRGDWYVWDGNDQRWKTVDADVVKGRLYKWIERTHAFPATRGRVGDVLGALAGMRQIEVHGEPPFWIEPRDDDPPAKSLLPFRNGVIRIDRPYSTELLPHDRRLFTLNRIECDYNPTAKCPRWEAFLAEAFPDDNEAVEVLEEELGYMLTEDNSLQKGFLWIGAKRSGRSTIARVIQHALGRDRTVNPTLSSLSDSFPLESWIGKTVAIVSDARSVDRFRPLKATETILSIIGRDGQTINRKHKTAWQGELRTRVVLIANAAPALKDATGVVATRWIAHDFAVSHFGREDPNLTETLIAELAGIINRWIAGLWRLRSVGYFRQPQSGMEVLEIVTAQTSAVKNFVEECCVTEADARIERKELYSAFVVWAKDNGHQSMASNSFGRDLHGLGLNIRPSDDRPGGRHGVKRNIYRGIALRSVAERRPLHDAEIVPLHPRQG